MGAEVTVCGPPTLIPRGIEAALGCAVRHDLDDLGEADVVYALRMQRERMQESFLPSMREYAALYQIDSRRLGPRQLLMHPGPVNRGIELSPEAIDGPSSLIAEQVEAGLYVRMAILFEVLTGPRAEVRALSRCPRASSRPRRRSGSRRERGAAGNLEPRLARRGELRRRTSSSPERESSIPGLGSTASVTSSSAAARSPSSPPRLRRAPRRRADRGRRPDRGAGLLRPPRPPADARPRGRGGHRDGNRAAAAGGYCGIVAMANTQPPVDTAEAILALRERADGEASVPVGFLACVTRGMRGEELTDMVELREAGALGFSDDGLPIRSARVMRRALQYQRIAGGQIALHEEDPELSGRRRHARGRGLGGARAGRDPVGLGVDDDRPRRSAGRLRGRPHPRPAPLRRASRWRRWPPRSRPAWRSPARRRRTT